MSLFLQTLVLRGILFREPEYRQERIGVGMTETTEGFGGKQVTRAWLSLILAGAWADHYAEAAMYLRLNGVLPPTAKK